MTCGDLVEILDDYPPGRVGKLAIYLRTCKSGLCRVIPLDTLKEEAYTIIDLSIVSKVHENERKDKKRKV